MTATYIGTKVINATPMTRLAYNELRGWTVPADENGADEGYLVEYRDGGQANHVDFKGYISWSPKDVFEKAYRKTDGLPWGLAEEALAMGERVARRSWNGKGQFVFKRPGDTLPAAVIQSVKSLPDATKNFLLGLDRDIKFLPYFCLFTAQGEVANGWVPSTTDLQADDWFILD